jgi:hypothetical protein
MRPIPAASRPLRALSDAAYHRRQTPVCRLVSISARPKCNSTFRSRVAMPSRSSWMRTQALLLAMRRHWKTRSIRSLARMLSASRPSLPLNIICRSNPRSGSASPIFSNGSGAEGFMNDLKTASTYTGDTAVLRLALMPTGTATLIRLRSLSTVLALPERMQSVLTQTIRVRNN